METFSTNDFPILPVGSPVSQLSFSEMLNQTSSNFEYNVNTSTELISPNTTASSSTSSSSQSSPSSEPSKNFSPYVYGNNFQSETTQQAQQPVYDYTPGYPINYQQQQMYYPESSQLNFGQYSNSSSLMQRHPYNTYHQQILPGQDTSIPLPANVQTPGSKLSRKSPKKKKKRDPNEPSRPVSAYALFFRETQSIIKAQKTDATFGEISKIVASMWDGLAENEKTVYKQKTENAKREYLRELAAYRASLVSNQQGQQQNRAKPY